MSQGDIERQTNLFRCYVSRVETGHTVPTLATLERWTKALGVSVGEFFAGAGPPQERVAFVPSTSFEKKLFGLLKHINLKDRKLLLAFATSMAKQEGKHGRS